MTTLSITPATAKGATLAGAVAVREQVQVTLVGLGGRVVEGLLLRILSAAGATLAACEQWTAAGQNLADAVGTLNLNTQELTAALENVRERQSRAYGLVVWSLASQELIVDVAVSIRANRTFEDESDPTPLAGLQVLAPADLGWSVAAGETLRSVAGPAPTYGDLVKAFRTLVADLKTRRVI